MQNKFNREPNFIERKRQWKGELDKPMKKRTLMMVLPAVILCVFVVMSAPYLKKIVEIMAEPEPTYDLKALNLEETPEAKTVEGPPPDVEELMAQRVRDELAAQGIDWQNPPLLPAIEPRLVERRELRIEPPPV